MCAIKYANVRSVKISLASQTQGIEGKLLRENEKCKEGAGV
jgi:hypothetical protein